MLTCHSAKYAASNSSTNASVEELAGPHLRPRHVLRHISISGKLGNTSITPSPRILDSRNCPDEDRANHIFTYTYRQEVQRQRDVTCIIYALKNVAAVAPLFIAAAAESSA